MKIDNGSDKVLHQIYGTHKPTRKQVKAQNDKFIDSLLNDAPKGRARKAHKRLW